MKVVGYLKTSLIEWPGQIASVIFTPECNFRCPFCHNAELLDPRQYRNMPQYSVEEILKDLQKRRKWIDGVAVTGGEPLLQPGLAEFLAGVKEMGFGVMVESNGFLTAKLMVIDEQGLVDHWAVDYKGRLDDGYDLYVGLSGSENDQQQLGKKGSSTAGRVKASFKYLFESPASLELRTTVVPGLHDESVIKKMAADLQRLKKENNFSKKVVWYLQGFQPKNCLDPEYRRRQPYSPKRMRNILKSAKQGYRRVRLRQK